MTDMSAEAAIARRFVVRTDDGVEHVAYAGMTKVVGFTLCRIGVRFTNAESLKKRWARATKVDERATCLVCLSREHLPPAWAEAKGRTP